MSSDTGRAPAEYIAIKVRGDAKKEIKPTISDADGKIILDYISQQTGEKGWKPHTAASNCRYTVKIAENIPNIKTWDYPTILGYVTMVRAKYKANTSRKDIMTLRVFVLWLLENRIVKGIKNEQVEKLQPTKSDKMTKTAADMLTSPVGSENIP
jgi:site-specific recombinase XerD